MKPIKPIKPIKVNQEKIEKMMSCPLFFSSKKLFEKIVSLNIVSKFEEDNWKSQIVSFFKELFPKQELKFSMPITISVIILSTFFLYKNFVTPQFNQNIDSLQINLNNKTQVEAEENLDYLISGIFWKE